MDYWDINGVRPCNSNRKKNSVLRRFIEFCIAVIAIGVCVVLVRN